MTACGSILLGLLLACSPPAAHRGGEVGQAAPEYTATTLDGDTVALTDFLGQPVLLNIWATWCPPCRREMPVLAEAARNTPGVEFLFVNYGEGRAAIERYLADEALAVSNVLLDPRGAVPRHYGTVGIPVTLFIDGDGRLTDMHMGEVSREALGEYIEELRN